MMFAIPPAFSSLPKKARPVCRLPLRHLAGFLQSTPASPGDCGQNLINNTIAEYPNETNITQAMTDLSKMDGVATAVNSFGGSLRTYTTSQATLIQHRAASGAVL